VAQISIPGGSGNTVTFTVTGSSAVNYANAFNAAVANAPVITNLGSGATQSTVAGALNLIESSTNTLYSLTTPGQYTYAAVTTPTTLVGSSGSDTVLGGGGLSYVAQGSNNNVTFTDGDNVFYGADVGGSTITGGAGNDIINTGTGSNTVFSGSGNGVINFGDTSGGDIAALFAGNTTINASGVSDTVFATASSDPNTSAVIFGGAGALGFVAGPSATPLSVSIVGGSGTTDMFAAAGSDIIFANSDGSAAFIAGAGNETLNGANANAGFAFFGDQNTADAGSINDTVYGGTGPDYFSTGAGNETIHSGAGAALFEINDLGAGTTITIANFGAGDFVNFAGLTTAQETSLLQTATVSNGNLTVTLDNGTQVEFLSATDLTGHLV
jgi:Ca2+-binding RTX toxin-like protein